jgi:hypothetical protein
MLEIERLKLSRCDRAQHRSAQAIQEEPSPDQLCGARGRAGALEGFGHRAYVRQSGLALRGPATATPPPAIGPPTWPRGPLANKRTERIEIPDATSNRSAAPATAPIVSALDGLTGLAGIGGYASPMRVTTQSAPRRSRYGCSG